MTRPLAPLHLLHGDREVRAYLHPVRMRILQFLAEAPRTSSQIAALLQVHPANLTHHFRKLQAAGLIRLVEERDLGRVVEKYYRAVAARFELREERAGVEGAGARALAVLERDLRAAARALGPAERRLVCHLENVRLPAEGFERFRRELEALARRYRAEATEGGPWYSLALALYPRAPEAFETPPGEAPGRRRSRRPR